MNVRSKVIEEARTWIGTPYHHAARIKGVGVDCIQLLLGVYIAAGVSPDFEIAYYPQDWHMHKSEELYLGGLEARTRKVEVPLPGDIAAFKFGRCVSHAAIVVEWPYVIHSYFRLGCVYSSAEDNEICRKLDSFWTPFAEGTL